MCLPRRGAALHLRDPEGFTALDLAEQYGRPPVVEALKKAQVKVRIGDVHLLTIIIQRASHLCGA